MSLPNAVSLNRLKETETASFQLHIYIYIRALSRSSDFFVLGIVVELKNIVTEMY